MQDRFRRLAVTLLSLALALAAGHAGAEDTAPGDAELYAAAKSEKVINWYTGLLQNQIVRPLIAGFEKKYPGITVEVVGGYDTDLLEKIMSGAKAGRLEADLTDGPSMAGEIIEAGLAEPYFPANAKDVPAAYKDPKGLWTAPTLFFITTSINTRLVKPGEEPKRLEDLLDPRWRGRMAWSGELSTAGQLGFIGAILDKLGDEQGRAYLRKLAAQRITTIPANPRVVMDEVIAGEHAIGLATYNHHAVASQAKGAPVEWLTLEPMVATMARSILLKGAPHPNGAKLLINYLLSAEGQRVFRDAGYIPSVSSLEARAPALKLDRERFEVFSPTPEEELGNMSEWSELYEELFL